MLKKSDLSAKQLLELVKLKDSDYWIKLQKEESLNLFHEAAQRVPAYKDFLKKNNINPDKVSTYDDFKLVPPISKKNYLHKYKLPMLAWDGSIDKPIVFTATSGSTGEPTYFMREETLDWQYSVLIEQYLITSGTANDGPTLVLICFGMGIWIAGIITYKAFEMVAHRGDYPISILTPGINKRDIFNALEKLSPNFKHTILVGYPPFIRDIIDEAESYSINLRELNIKLLFAAEAISEEFRNFVARKAGINNKYSDIMNIYGSADIGAMATEYSTSVVIKSLARKSKKIFSDIFSPINKTPTLAQYNPFFINFEAQDGEILLTGNNTIPLVRYMIGDQGGVLTYNQILSVLNKADKDVIKEAQKNNIEKTITQLPFVYVYERTDFSTTFYGLLIYPEWMKSAFLEKPLVEYFTGKFTLITKHDNKMNQILQIHIELQKEKKVTKAVKQIALKKIVSHLRKNSSEYREITNQLKKKGFPKLIFWPYEDSTYFRPGTKQKWVLQKQI